MWRRRPFFNVDSIQIVKFDTTTTKCQTEHDMILFVIISSNAGRTKFWHLWVFVRVKISIKTSKCYCMWQNKMGKRILKKGK